MNKESLKHIRSYHMPGCSNFVARSKNAVYFSSGSTIRHELSKAVGGLMLIKWGDIKFNPAIIKHLTALEESIKVCMKDFPKQKADFITECVPNKEKDRRVDLVNVDDNTRFEFETNSNIKKEGCITIYI